MNQLLISEKPTPDEINAEIKRRIGNNLKDFLSDYRDYAKELGLTDESVLLLAILRESKITNDILQQ